MDQSSLNESIVPTESEKARNLTTEQRAVLIESVENLKDIIQCKDGKAGASSRKNAAWTKIAANVNSHRPMGSQLRTVQQIRKCWENISSKSRQEISKKKKESKATGGGPSSGMLTVEEEKILNIYGDTNPILVGERFGINMMNPIQNVANYLDLSAEDIGQPQSTKIPKINEQISQTSAKRKFVHESNRLSKEQLTLDVLESEMAKNRAEIEKFAEEIELMKELKAAAASKKAYYDSLNMKVQIETAILTRDSNIQIVNAD